VVTYCDQSARETFSLCIHCAPLFVGYSPTSSFDEFGSARSVFFYQYYINYYSVYDLISNLIGRLWLTWLSVFSVGGHIRVWILFYFIILFYLACLFETSICPKGFLLWPLVGTEKVESSPFVPGWYRESLIYYYIFFFYTDSYLLLAIWQLKSYSNSFVIYTVR
jgi:hypothetical protein